MDQQSDGTVLRFIDSCFLFQLKILLINFIFGWNNTLCPTPPLCMLVLLKCNKQWSVKRSRRVITGSSVWQFTCKNTTSYIYIVQHELELRLLIIYLYRTVAVTSGTFKHLFRSPLRREQYKRPLMSTCFTKKSEACCIYGRDNNNEPLNLQTMVRAGEWRVGVLANLPIFQSLIWKKVS